MLGLGPRWAARSNLRHCVSRLALGTPTGVAFNWDDGVPCREHDAWGWEVVRRRQLILSTWTREVGCPGLMCLLGACAFGTPE